MKFDLLKSLNQDLSICSQSNTVSVIPQLSHIDYSKIKNLLNSIGGIWSSSNQNFQFKKDPNELIDRVIKNCGKSINKFHFYPTPSEVLKFITDFTPLSYIGYSSGAVKTLEPSCGEGAMLDYLKSLSESGDRKFEVTGYEIDPLNKIICDEKGHNVELENFLDVDPVAEYDLVLMNPPFNGEEYIKHLKHAQKFLKDTGVIISVVPATWLKEPLKNKGRAWLLEHAQINDRLSNADLFAAGTFEGVNIETMVVTIDSKSFMDSRLNNIHAMDNEINEMTASLYDNKEYCKQVASIKNDSSSKDDKVIALSKLVSASITKPLDVINYYHTRTNNLIDWVINYEFNNQDLG